MPFEPLRFIHAANLNLDRPLASIGDCGSAVREIAENATLTSFERIVGLCIEHNVDFLLLTGNAFDEADRSLRARIALCDGFERLDASGIRTFVLPGVRDPAEAWRAIPELPDNVTVFYESDNEPVAVIRDDRVIASVAAGSLERFLRPPDDRSEPSTSHWQIGLATLAQNETSAANRMNPAVDYLALGGEHQRTTCETVSQTAHHPGAAQGSTDVEAGPHGCTLVVVDADRSAQTLLLTTAAVRWERIAVALTADLNRDDLFQLMRDELRCDPPTASEQVRIVSWTLRGSGELFDALGNDETRERFFESLQQTAFPESPVLCLMRAQLVSEGTVGDRGPDARSDQLLASFVRAIDTHETRAAEFVSGGRGAIGIDDPRCHDFAARCDADIVIRHARRLGGKWLDGDRAEGRSA